MAIPRHLDPWLKLSAKQTKKEGLIGVRTQTTPAIALIPLTKNKKTTGNKNYAARGKNPRMGAVEC